MAVWFPTLITCATGQINFLVVSSVETSPLFCSGFGKMLPASTPRDCGTPLDLACPAFINAQGLRASLIWTDGWFRCQRSSAFDANIFLPLRQSVVMSICLGALKCLLASEGLDWGDRGWIIWVNERPRLFLPFLLHFFSPKFSLSSTPHSLQLPNASTLHSLRVLGGVKYVHESSRGGRTIRKEPCRLCGRSDSKSILSMMASEDNLDQKGCCGDNIAKRSNSCHTSVSTPFSYGKERLSGGDF